MGKRLLGSLVVVGLVFVLGCETKKEADVIVWWAKWAPAEGLQELGDEFTKESGLSVAVKQIPWSDYQTQVFLNFGNPETNFDIVVGDSQWIGQGATRGLYLDLSDWLPKAVDMSKVHPRAAKYLCEYPSGSGKYFAAPCETDAVGFAYRKDWFEDEAEKKAFKDKYGRDLAIPETWEQFAEVAAFFTRPEKKQYGCAILTGRGYDSLTMGFQQFLWMWGGSWGDPDTFAVEGKVNAAGAVEGLAFLKELLKSAPEGGTNFDYGKAVENFKNGSCAMSMAYFAFFPDIVEKMGDKAGFFMVPSNAGKRVVSLGGQGFSISKKIPAARQENAKKFIAWFLKTENQKKWITKPAGFTANVDILKSDAFRDAAPYNAAFADSLDNLQDFWNIPVYDKLLAVAQKYVGEALDDVKKPKEALDAIAKEHAQIFKDAGLTK